MARRRAAERLANFCLATGQTPEVYMNLTELERGEFIRQVKQANRK